MRQVLNFLGVISTSAILTAAGTHAGQLTFDILFGDNPGGKLPKQITWAPDGERLSYVWDDGEGKSLWVLDVTSGESTVLVSTDELAVSGHQWAPDGTSILIESEGAVHLLNLDDGSTHLLSDDGDEEDPKFSPDSSQVAFVRDYDLHVVDRRTGDVRALTHGGEENEILNGVTDWVYWEELWGRDSTGYWWSPDGTQIAYYQFDESPVPSYPLVNLLTTHAEVEWQRYPKSGQALPLVRVGVLDLASGETHWMQTATPEDHYFPRVHWAPDGDRLVISQLDRDQNQVDLLSCDPATGSCSTLMTETWPTWINLHDDFRWLADGGFLWSSEKSGFRALYLHDGAGAELRRLTPEGWSVGAVRGFNAQAGWVIVDAFSTAELGALHRGIFKQDLAGGDWSELAAATATHRATVSDSSGRWVHVWSDANTPRGAAIRDLAGNVIGSLPHALPEGYDATRLPRWEFATVAGPNDANLPVAMLKPADFDPTKRYPVIMYHYGCPASQVVIDAWGSRGRGLWHKMMAERGYIVFSLDNIASRFFGKAGEDHAYRSFGPGNVKAQLAGVEYLRSLPYVDAERIGLWGWSGGGYNTLYALTHAPGVWMAGMAGAPVSDWKFYDAIWTERYMDTPEDNPEGYATASALAAADQLEDHLLIVHGTADDNVHPQNSLAMVAELIAAGKPFEQAIHPRQKHGFRGADSEHFYRRMTEFFERHLDREPDPAPEVAEPSPRGAQP
ncbi:MAG: DPP IV N-terminal domain-containing protein [Acidobacteria bacterium]|nr:DPP IV N-terminal domain-containing protein [Acidobacteriota bacterium]